MTVHVGSAYWGGVNGNGFLLTLPTGQRFRVRGEDWNRATATEALNLLEVETGKPRRCFRFKVR